MSLEVIRIFGEKSLNLFSHEEDFILGILLGYDRIKQCHRYLERRRRGSKVEELAG